MNFLKAKQPYLYQADPLNNFVEYGAVVNLNDYKGDILIEDSEFARSISAFTDCWVLSGTTYDHYPNLGWK